MDNIVFNKCQTPLENLELNKYPVEVQENKFIVYKHTSPSGKVYVGITKLSPNERWKKNGNGYIRCRLFYRAIKKYGWENFKHEIILKNISESEACYTEKYLIRWYKIHNLSYNIVDGGETISGFVMPESAKIKIAKFSRDFHSKPVLQFTLKGKYIQEFSSAIEASKVLGFGHTSVSNCASGIKRENVLHGYIFIYKDELDTLPSRLKLCKDHWKKYKIVQYKDGKIINIFNSIREAERTTGINRVCIRKNIRGEFKRAGKYTWKKVKEEELYGIAI